MPEDEEHNPVAFRMALFCALLLIALALLKIHCYQPDWFYDPEIDGEEPNGRASGIAGVVVGVIFLIGILFRPFCRLIVRWGQPLKRDEE